MKSCVLENLRSEHRAMRKLLELLQHQIELVADDRQPNGELLLEIAEYFRSYPDLFHHPKEELILRCVVRRKADAAEDLATLEAEHEACSRELHRFSRAVVRLLLDPADGSDRFLSAALAFLDNERRHLSWEEQRFFSLAAECLTAEDWAEIEASLANFADPRFERDAQARFGRIDRALGSWRSRMAA
ncbi:MAG: hemerythrin domain-containing protein [Hyphomicrobiaceae bacterium]|nr:hemerythrin domain-containing protein [Hyphomicrobiaceae bacterium]